MRQVSSPFWTDGWKDTIDLVFPGGVLPWKRAARSPGARGRQALDRGGNKHHFSSPGLLIRALVIEI